VFKRQDLFQPKSVCGNGTRIPQATRGPDRRFEGAGLASRLCLPHARFDVLRVTVCAVIVSGLLDPHHHRHLWPPVALLQAELLAGLPSWSMRVLDLTAMRG